MISTVDLVLKKMAKNRAKNQTHAKSKHRHHSSDDSVDEDIDAPKEVPIPVVRSSKHQITRKDSSDDSAVYREKTLEKQRHLSSGSDSDHFSTKNARREAKNRSTRSNVETKRVKKSKNVRSSTKSNKSKKSSKNREAVDVDDVQSDDGNIGRITESLHKKFRSVDMLNSANDTDANYRSDSQSNASLRHHEEDRRNKSRSIYLELKQRQEQERKKTLTLEMQLKEAQYGGSATHNSKVRSQAMPYDENLVSNNLRSKEIEQYKSENHANEGYNSNEHSALNYNHEQIAPTMKQMTLSDHGQGARSKHYPTTQAVIEQSKRQSQRSFEGPTVPQKPKKKNSVQESYMVSSIPPPRDGNFRRVPFSQIKAPDITKEARASYRPQQQPHHSEIEAERSATLSHSRRHDFNAPVNPAPYEMNKQWHQEGYPMSGQQYYDNTHRLRDDSSQDGTHYPYEYEKRSHNGPEKLPLYYNQNNNVPLTGNQSYDPRLQPADLV